MADITRRDMLKKVVGIAAIGVGAVAATKFGGDYLRWLHTERKLEQKEVELALNKNTGDKELIRLSKNDSKWVRLRLASREYGLPTDAQINLSKDWFIPTLIALSKRKELSPEAADNIVRSEYLVEDKRLILVNIAKQKKLLPETLDRIVSLNDYGAYEAKTIIAKRKDTNVETLRRLIENSTYPEVVNAAKESLAKRTLLR